MLMRCRNWTVLQSIISAWSPSLYYRLRLGDRHADHRNRRRQLWLVHSPRPDHATLLQLSISNASFGIYFPKFIGTFYEFLSAPISYLEIVIAFVGAAATKSVVIGLVILATAAFFVPIRIDHVALMLFFMVLTAVTFCLFGFIIGIWADGFEKLSLIPLLIVTPLAFLGGTFYSIDMLPPFWQTVSLVNPVVYLVSGFRWSFYSISDVSVTLSIAMTFVFLAICIALVAWIFKTGYRLKT